MRTFSGWTKRGLGGALAAGVLVVALIASHGAEAQPARQVTPAPATAAIVAPANKLSPELQQLLKTGKNREAQALIKKPPTGGGNPAASGAVVGKPPGPGPQPYICATGNCACAGASDCVTMIAADKVCKEGTVGCNDNGCTCQGN